MGNVILVVNPDEKYYMQKKGSEYMNNCYTPLELKKKIEEKEIEISRDIENPIQEHLWLTKYPADKAYVQMTKNNEVMDIERKINAIENIVSYLGGTNFCAESFDGITSKIGGSFHTDSKGSASIEEIPPINFGNSFDAQGNVSFDGKYNVKSTTKWSGKCTQESYDRAKEIAKETHLDQDSTIQYLLEQRNPKHPNQLTAKTYMVNVRRDVSANAELASSMSTSLSSLFGLDLNMKLNADVNTTQQSEFKFSVEFLPAIPQTSMLGSSKESDVLLPPVTSPSINNDEPIDAKIESVSTRLADYALSSFVDAKVAELNSELERRALSEYVDSKLESVSTRFSDYVLASDLDTKVTGINSELGKRALGEDVDAKFESVSTRLADYALSSDVDAKVAGINSELERRALSEDVDSKLESVSIRFADYVLASDLDTKVTGINSELEKRALGEDVDAKFESVSTRLADYALSSDVDAKIEGVNSEMAKRALCNEVDAKFESVSARFADYALSSNVDDTVAGINANVEKKAQIETVTALQNTVAYYKKIALYVSIGLGILSISGLAMAIYLFAHYVW